MIKIWYRKYIKNSKNLRNKQPHYKTGKNIEKTLQ